MARKNNNKKYQKKLYLKKGSNFDRCDQVTSRRFPLRYKWFQSTWHKIRFLKHFYFWSNSKYLLRYGQISVRELGSGLRFGTLPGKKIWRGDVTKIRQGHISYLDCSLGPMDLWVTSRFCKKKSWQHKKGQDFYTKELVWNVTRSRSIVFFSKMIMSRTLTTANAPQDFSSYQFLH